MIASHARAYFHRPFVAVTGKGLLLRVLGRQPRLYPWYAIDGVEFTRVGIRSRTFVRLKNQSRRIEVTALLGSQGHSHDGFRNIVFRRTSNPIIGATSQGC